MGTPANVAPTTLPAPEDIQRLAAAAAVTTALPLLLIVLALGGIAIWGVRRAAAGGNVEVEAWPATLNAKWLSKCPRLPGARSLTLVLPTLTLIFTHRERYDFSKIWTEYTDQITGSIFLAGLGGIAALFIAGAASVRRHRGLLALGLAAFLIGGQLLAIALIRLYNRPLLSGWVYNAPPIMVMAYVARFGWLVLLAAGATWSPRWRTLRDMAAVDGAGPGRAALHVVWPLAWPLLVASTLLVAGPVADRGPRHRPDPAPPTAVDHPHADDVGPHHQLRLDDRGLAPADGRRDGDRVRRRGAACGSVCAGKA